MPLFATGAVPVGPDVAAFATKTEVATLAAAVPVPAVVAPPQTTDNTPTLGAEMAYARADHTHPTRLQSKTLTLDANGEAEWTFTTPFTAEPNVRQPTYFETANSQPIILKVKDFRRATANGGSTLHSAGATGNFVEVIVKGYRLRTLPATLTLLTALISFDITLGTGLSGIKVYVSAAPS